MKSTREKTRNIVPNQDFLDGTTRYKEGVSYTVPRGRAEYFEINGWIGGDEESPKTSWFRRFLNG